MKHSARELAERLAHAAGGAPQPPTDEQVAVIEAPAAPTLVVADSRGTSSQRHLWSLRPWSLQAVGIAAA